MLQHAIACTAALDWNRSIHANTALTPSPVGPKAPRALSQAGGVGSSVPSVRPIGRPAITKKWRTFCARRTTTNRRSFSDEREKYRKSSRVTRRARRSINRKAKRDKGAQSSIRQKHFSTNNVCLESSTPARHVALCMRWRNAEPQTSCRSTSSG